ncbi:MAG: hypothetical protein AAGK37_18130 [Pseudomonadota bacterium]
MSKYVFAALAALLMTGSVAQAATIQLFLEEEFTFDASALAYKPPSAPGDEGTLFLGSDSEGPGRDGTITKCTLSGGCVDAFETGFGQIGGLAVMGDNLVVVDTVASQAKVGIFDSAATGDATPLSTFDAFTRFFDDDPSLGDPDAVYFDASTNEIVVADEFEARLDFYSLSGDLLRSWDTTSFSDILTEPQGLTRDPITGNYLIANDTGGTNGAGLLFEVSSNGAVLNTYEFFGTDDRPLVDIEGLSFDSANNRLFVAFDQEDTVATFAFTPTVVPLPPAGMFLLAGVAAFGFVRRKRGNRA